MNAASLFRRPCCHTLLRRPLALTGYACWQQRHVAGVRRLLGGFIRAVHPDLTPSFPQEARRINQLSLAELNAFIDRVETDGIWRLEEGPEAARELAFFRARETRSGRVLPGLVLPVQLALPSLPAQANESDREFAAVRLIRDVEIVLESSASEFSDKPDVAPLFKQKGASRASFDKLWAGQTQEELVREAIYGPDDDEVRLHVAKRMFASKYGHQMMRRYLRYKNSKRRKLKIQKVDALVEAKVQKKFKHVQSPMQIRIDSEREEMRDNVRVLQGGFHPDLVFLAPGISDQQRREAVRRVCGMNLEKDSDFWLLENLWKAMRGTAPPVPLVVAEKDYIAHVNAGFIQVPWNFSVLGLCDVLEEHLEAVREGLLRRRRRGGAGGSSALPPPPEEAEVLARPPSLQLEGVSDASDDEEDEDELSSSEDEEPRTL